ncbi:imidazole glycerol phosphate synthase subunit HisH [Kangiella sp. TOML190]|uniref:imidazole glycerol phosphate synthase subunit HisH n=1 Tax=Kangiella sp. TOML190 TaxID=2931351 RepID=UPI00203BE4A6|nr:imidazole glycerol phosphate synthase subunit HisH [Kangiella sp. TOML190]
MTSSRVAVVDTKAGNLFSILSALERIGFTPILVGSADDIQKDTAVFNALVIPGQGRFGAVMRSLRTNGLDSLIKDWYLSGRKLLGICVGMQIFFAESEEDIGVSGLGLLEGQVKRLQLPKRPMVGWCELDSKQLWLDKKCVYFVNGYGVSKTESETSRVEYGEGFVASIRSKGLTAFQFHPEKSGSVGEEMLRQCLI